MHIDKIISPDNTSIDQANLSKTHPLPPKVKPDQTSQPLETDVGTTSIFSNIMADSTPKLREETAVRQDKIDAMRAMMENDNEVTDDQIDTIMDRILNS